MKKLSSRPNGERSLTMQDKNFVIEKVMAWELKQKIRDQKIKALNKMLVEKKKNSLSILNMCKCF